MEFLFFIAAFVGSCSIGYSLLRTGFPKKQGATLGEKIGLGYLFGILVILPGIIAWMAFGIEAFFLISGVFYLFLFVIFIVKRKSYNENDDIHLKKDEKKIILPKKLILKDNKTQRQEMVTTSKVKEQLFKEKQPNVITEINKKTNEIERKDNEKEKSEMLKKLKNFAKRINERKVDEDEINEDELEELSKEEF